KAVGMVRRGLAQRASARNARRLLATRPALLPGQFTIAVYFADSAVNIYQMRQWYAPLAELSRHWPVLVIARHPAGAEALLEDGRLPVAFAPTVAHLERL